MTQYSTGMKAWISRSRSTMILTATDCTRPAERPLAHLLPEQRADLVADEPVEDAPGLLGVDELDVDLPGMLEGGLDGLLGDLVENDAVVPPFIRSGDLRQVPGDGLALAVGVGGQVDIRGVLGRLLELVDQLGLVLGHDVLGREAVLDVHADLPLGQVTDVARARP